MNTTEVLEKIGDSIGTAATVRSVFGEPIHAEGKTIVPIAKISYGFGVGGGHRAGKNGADAGREGGGGGGGVRAFPVGVLEVTPTRTRFVSYTEPHWAVWTFAVGTLISGMLLRRRH